MATPARRGVRAGVVAALSGVAALAVVAAGGLGFGLGRASVTTSNAPSPYAAGSGETNSGSGSTGSGSGSGSGLGGSGGSGGYGGYGGSGGSGGSGGYGGSGGSGGYGYGGLGGGSGDTGSGGTGTSTHTTAATAKQSVGVVDINTKLKYEQAEAAGTGIVLTSDGEVLTNNHVVEDATSIRVVVVATGKTYTAKVVGTDAADDVAVLKLTGASGLSTVQTASTTAKVGDKVVGVGNAGGTGRLTSTAGKVIGLHKSITTQPENWVAAEHLTNMIETNADIQAGDSGGPLYNSAGQVIGIDTAGSDGPSRGSQTPGRAAGSSGTTGLAIPIAKALSIAGQIESGKASSSITIGYPAFLGVEVAEASQRSYGTGEYTQSPTARGAVIGGVLKGTPAAKAGLTAGDVITKVGDTAVKSAAGLSSALSKYRPGQSVEITWVTSAGAASHTRHATVALMAGPAA